jgi:uncharacterized protein (DUF2252 family)
MGAASQLSTNAGAKRTERTRTPASVPERVLAFNRERERDRVRIKYQKMRESPFAFFRGTCHLFWEDAAKDRSRNGEVNAAPLAWISGDLHFENFGAYKGDNRLEYWDINDFDEAVLAPCTWDPARFLTSLLVGAQALELERKAAIALCRSYLDSYVAALREGKARWLERETANGMVKDLLQLVRTRKRKELLAKKTVMDRGRRRIRIDGVHALAASRDDRRKASSFMDGFAKKQSDPDFFRVLDVARRIAGTGSLGLDRYAILVAGKGGGKNYLLDMKNAAPPAPRPYLTDQQPPWPSEAERVVTIQRQAQAASSALLQPVRMEQSSYILRELQPTEDRLSLEHWNGKMRRLENAVLSFGEVTAWAHLRGSGRKGASVADALIEFSGQRAWPRAVLEYAQSYSERVIRDWKEFCAAIDDGFFDRQVGRLRA